MGTRSRSGMNPILKHGLHRIPAQAPCVFWRGLGSHVFGSLGASGTLSGVLGASWRHLGQKPMQERMYKIKMNFNNVP